MRAFVDAKRSICRGLLLTYDNGGMRALGECRLGVDDSWATTHPAAICFQEKRYWTYPSETYKEMLQYGAAVAITAVADSNNTDVVQAGQQQQQHMHAEDDGWTCCTIGQGILHFYWMGNVEYMMAYEP